MSPDTHILLSGALSFGVPLLLAVRELVVLGRDAAGGRAGGDDTRGRNPAPPPPSDEPSLQPLPPCLVQALQGRPVHREAPAPRVRELERV